MNILENKINDLIKNEITKLGYYLINVQYLKESGENFLRITVDKDGDMSLEDIVLLNEKINPIIDKADLIKDAYMLDILSLGAEKPIHVEHLDKYVGKYLNIHLSHPFKGLNILEGDLISVTKDIVTIEIRDKSRKIKVNLERKYIDKARLAIKF